MLKRLLFCVLLLFSLLFTCHADVTLTDQEYEIIETALTTSQQELETQKNQLIELEQDLKNSQSIQNQLSEEQKILNRIMTMQEQELTTLSTSLEKQRTETILDKIYNFFIGLLSGSCLVTIIYLINL